MNEILFNILLNNIIDGRINIEDIKIKEYKDRVQKELNK